MRKHKSKIIAGVVIAILLAFVFWYGGDAPGLRGWSGESEEAVTAVRNDEPDKEEFKEAEETVGDIPTEEEITPDTEENAPANQEKMTETDAEKSTIAEIKNEGTQSSAEETTSSGEIKSGDEVYSEKQGMVINDSAGKDQYKTDPVPEGKPVPVEPENAVITDKELTCTLSVRCDTILNNIGWLDSEKIDIVPQNGIIFAEKTVVFYEGESVFNVLVREMKRNKIHLEFENTPIYNSAYIEGIANLYEFDCGELSGWMYKVNDWFPNYGCSRYQLKDGDRVEWAYTCDLGNDIGGHYSARNGN